MRRTTFAAAALLAAAFSAGAQAQAAGVFAAAFDAAVAHDAQYRAAGFELASAEQARPIARASLLPSAALTYSESRVQGERDIPNALGQTFTQVLDYRNPVTALQIRAPLFDAQAYQRWRLAGVQVEAAHAVYLVRGQELLDRLGTAYTQRLFAQDALALAAAEVEALRSQAEMASRRLQGGEGTRTDIADAEAGLALARVRLIEAEDQRDLAQQALVRLTGDGASALQGLPEDLPAQALPLPDLAAWTARATVTNPSLAARRLELESARTAVRQARAGHLPRLDLVASAIDARNDTISTLNQRTRQYSAGVQLTVPLFQGGGVDATVVQAGAEVAKAEALLDSDTRQVLLDVDRQFKATQTGTMKVDALRQSLAASALALDSARRGLAAGFRSMADVLDALRRVFQGRRELVQARYDLLLARLRLQALAGLPTEEIVADMDRHLTGPAPGTLPMETPR
jgi:protease secretion system outer membrane protein